MTGFLDDVPLHLRNQMYYQQDGAPAHNGRQVSMWLNLHFPERWIGNNGPIMWPPRSPDLNPLDFFYWGHMKQLVYAEPSNTREELLQKINAAAEQIEATVDLQRIYNSLVKRCRACIEVNGQHFEHFLK